jgi:hypothetical protein
MIHYSNVGNSFLHLCDDPEFFAEALAWTPDINHLNAAGNTALHEAMRRNKIEKVNFLLSHGANTDIKNAQGETFWTIKVEFFSASLNLYRLYRKQGHTLIYPPVMSKQKGPNCGFYAVTCAATLFHNNPIPARKCDKDPRAILSLRQLRHELGISGKGEIFSAYQLQKVIEKTACKSLVCDVSGFDHFMEIIKKATAENLPIIIPYSSDPDTKKAEKAHWSVIFGWRERNNQYDIIFANHGQYEEADVESLFDAFYDIEPTFPGQYLEKRKGEEWLICKTEPQANEETKVHLVAPTSLDDFRRKLVVVFPEGYDCNRLNIDSAQSMRLLKNK